MYSVIGIVAATRFALALAGGEQYQSVCDPFGRLGTECIGVMEPTASFQIGLRTHLPKIPVSTRWHVEGAGSIYEGPLTGSHAQLAAHIDTLRIGSTDSGLDGEFFFDHWDRQVIRLHSLQLGTTRHTLAAFAGIHVGLGDWQGFNARLSILSGYWQNQYRGTISNDTFSQDHSLAQDQSTLSRARLSVRNFPLGTRVTTRADLEYTRIWPVTDHTQRSSVTPADQFMGTIGAEVCLRQSVPCRLSGTVELGLADHRVTLLGTTHLSVSLQWTLK